MADSACFMVAEPRAGTTFQRRSAELQYTSFVGCCRTGPSAFMNTLWPFSSTGTIPCAAAGSAAVTTPIEIRPEAKARQIDFIVAVRQARRFAASLSRGIAQQGAVTYRSQRRDFTQVALF